jgi:hypothetical protein
MHLLGDLGGFAAFFFTPRRKERKDAKKTNTF